MEKLRILFIGPTPPPYHGVTVMNKILLSSQFCNVFHVDIIETNYSEKITDLNSLSLDKIKKLLSHINKIIKLSSKNKYDFVCYPINFTRNALLRDFLLLFAIKLFPYKIIYYTHGNNLPSFIKNENALIKGIIHKVMRYADGAVVVGENLRFNYKGILPDELVVPVHHGMEGFVTKPKARQASDEIRVLYLSNLVLTKGFFVLIQAIPKIVQQVKNIKFIFGGEWENAQTKEDVMRYIEENNLSEFIEFKGRVIGEEKEKLYYDSDIFVFPTFYPLETFGIVNLEAMQAGLPIITTGRGAIPEIVEEGKNGFIVPEQNPEAIADKIILLFQNKELRENIRNNNIQRFKDFYTKEKYAQRMIDAFLYLHKKLDKNPD
ncbi:glycosyl transferase group 1 [Chloroherpeton thalassium ATCC 35110]|uniref:Glycosyl transferase group 1 n=2 Tax=Chloroherpeton thalassium TaxID=100716 RepID=B3QYU2_CHLT3|nr:glycosyl transferase group 1 [Chloroherpeton thalassium ATCC 35110]